MKAFRFTFVLIFMISLKLFSQSIISDTTLWKGETRIAYNYILAGDLSNAEKMFNSFTDTREYKYYGYLGLGLVELTKDSISNAAEDYFNKVITHYSKRDQNHEKLVGLALAYLGEIDYFHGDTLLCFDQWEKALVHYGLSYLEIEKFCNSQNLDYRYDESIVNIMIEKIQSDSYSLKETRRLAKLGMWYQQEEDVLEAFSNLKVGQKYPAIYFDMAELAYRSEKYDDALNYLDTLNNLDPEYSISQFNFIKAKILFSKNDKDAYKYYSRGLSSLNTDADAKYLYNDIYYILKEEEYSELQSTPLDSLKDFYTKFWFKRDPDKSTRFNERIKEHYLRLAYARKHFRNYLIRETPKEKMSSWLHPMWQYVENDITGEQFLKNLMPSFFMIDRDLDDKGLIYVKHGNPDILQPQKYNDINIKSSEFWAYDKMNANSQIVFYFHIGFEGSRGWKLASLPVTTDGFDILDNKINIIELDLEKEDLGGDIFSAKQKDNLTSLSNTNKLRTYNDLNTASKKAIYFGLNNETSEFYKDRDELRFKLDIINFKTDSGKTLVNILYGLEGENTQLDSKGNLDLDKFIGIYTKEYDEVGEINKHEKIKLGLSQEEWEESSIMRLDQLQVSGGEYNCEMKFVDKVSGNIGLYKDTLLVPNYDCDTLMLSDLLISKPFSDELVSTYFNIKNVSYSPHMFKAFDKSYPLGLYFEVYNLELNNDKQTNYEISIIIKDQTGERYDLASLSMSNNKYIKMTNEYSGNKKDDVIFLNIDLNSLNDGTYDLYVIATDRIQNKKYIQKTSFTVDQ